MKCLCFSDSHGKANNIRRALNKHPNAEVIFFLGDGLSDIENFLYDRSRAWFVVRGNCDYSPFVADRITKKTDVITLMSKKIIITHGDLYSVKSGIDEISKLAEREIADIVLFGHTHFPLEKYISTDNGGYYLFNPGSIGVPYRTKSTYGVIDIVEAGVSFSHIEL